MIGYIIIIQVFFSCNILIFDGVEAFSARLVFRAGFTGSFRTTIGSICVPKKRNKSFSGRTTAERVYLRAYVVCNHSQAVHYSGSTDQSTLCNTANTGDACFQRKQASAAKNVINSCLDFRQVLYTSRAIQQVTSLDSHVAIHEE